MFDLDLINHKIGNIQNCLASIKTYTNNLDLSTLSDLKTQDAVVINLERVIQSCVDIANHIISKQKLGTPSSMKESFKIIAKHEIIDSELSLKLMKMVGFRNIAVHSYDELDQEILLLILEKHLNDFEIFYKKILEKIRNI